MLPGALLLDETGHNGVIIPPHASRRRTSETMPSLMRFLAVIGTIAGLLYGSMYVLAVYFEPEPHEITKNVHGVKIRK